MGLEEDPEPGGGREEGKTEDKAGASLSAFSPPPPKHLTSLSSHLPDLLPTLRLQF